ncbi:hypothetical protein, partial [Salmonella enterica]|uniref:hypothetical protein n=1 Tax=Salmonella enterica TaxID=28901 RepID=UPI0020C41864
MEKETGGTGNSTLFCLSLPVILRGILQKAGLSAMPLRHKPTVILLFWQVYILKHRFNFLIST